MKLIYKQLEWHGSMVANKELISRIPLNIVLKIIEQIEDRYCDENFVMCVKYHNNDFWISAEDFNIMKGTFPIEDELLLICNIN